MPCRNWSKFFSCCLPSMANKKQHNPWLDIICSREASAMSTLFSANHVLQSLSLKPVRCRSAQIGDPLTKGGAAPQTQLSEQSTSAGFPPLQSSQPTGPFSLPPNTSPGPPPKDEVAGASSQEAPSEAQTSKRLSSQPSDVNSELWNRFRCGMLASQTLQTLACQSDMRGQGLSSRLGQADINFPSDTIVV